MARNDDWSGRRTTLTDRRRSFEQGNVGGIDPPHRFARGRRGQRRSPSARSALAGTGAAIVLSLISGCSPALDWREQLAPGVGLVTSFPCSPDRHARVVALAGQQVRMEMLVCAAGGATYAVGFFDVPGPADASAALASLRSVQIGNIQSGEDRDGRKPPQPIELAIRGMTPDPQAGQWLVEARRPDGSPLTAREAFFAHGSRVYQAAVVGSHLPIDAVEPFFAGLKFPG